MEDHFVERMERTIAAAPSDLPPLPEVEEFSRELRRESRRIRPGDALALVLEDGTVAPLELAVIRYGRTAQVCDATLFDISDGGLSVATAVHLPAGERITLCATCETEPEPLFSEDLVVLGCRRRYEGNRAFFVSGFEFSDSAFSRLYKAALDTLFLNRMQGRRAQAGAMLRQ